MIARGRIAGIEPVTLIIAVVPSASGRRPAAGGPKMAFIAGLIQRMAEGAAVQIRITVEQLTLFIQPSLPNNMAGAFPVAVMTIIRGITVGSVEVMALIACFRKFYVIPMGVIVAVSPSCFRRCPAAGGPKMATKAFLVWLVAIPATVKGFIAMKLLAGFVQPWSIQCMGDAFSMAVVANVRTGVEHPVDTMAFVTDAHVCRHSRMLSLTVNPTGSIRLSTPFDAEMAFITAGNIFRSLKTAPMAGDAG